MPAIATWRMPQRGLRRVHAQLGPECGAGPQGRIGVELHVAAQELLGRQVAEDEEGVGHRRFGPAPAVTRRARDRAGRAGPHPQHPPGVGPPDRPPAGADRLDVDEGQRRPHAHELAPGAPDGLSARDDGDIEGCPAHVAGDHVGDPLGPRELGRGSDAGRRSRFGQTDRYPARLVDRDGPSRRVHEKERHGEAPLLQRGRELLDAGKGAGDVRVEEGEGGALVFAHGRVQRRSGDDRNGGEPLVDHGQRVLFVHGVAERPQERERECVGLLDLNQVVGRPHQLFGIERLDDGPVAVDPLAHPDDPVARDDLGRCGEPAVLIVHLAPTGEGDELLEALGRDEPDASPGPRRQHVGHRGGAQAEPAHRGQHHVELRARTAGRELHCLEDALADVGGRGGRLRPAIPRCRRSARRR